MLKKIVLLGLLFLSHTSFAQELQYPTSGTDCGENCSWKIDGETLTLTGYGKINSFDRICNQGHCYTNAPWYLNKENIKNIVFQNMTETTGFTEIGNYAFADLSWVKRVEFPQTLTKIGEGSFLNDARLTGVDLPQSLTSIGSYAFDAAPLMEIELPSLITKIEACTFGNSQITSIVIPENVTSISEKAFTISTGESSTPLEKVYCPVHLIEECSNAVSFRTDKGSQVDIVSYRKTTNGTFLAEGKYYASMQDIGKNNSIKKRIYSVQEANEVSGKTNRVSLRYK